MTEPGRRRHLTHTLVGWGGFAWLLLALPLLAACKADVAVDIGIEDDGSGVVLVSLVLDREAAAGLIDLGDNGLRLDDLVQTGWELEPPTAAPDGSVTTRASKAFGTPEQFRDIIDELSGSSGLLVDFELERTRSFARVDHRMSGTLQPNGLDVFSDPELDAALQQTLGQLAANYGGSAADVNVEVSVTLPGDDDASISSGTVDLDGSSGGSTRRWSANLADSSSIEIATASSTQQVSALVWRGVAVVAAVLAMLVLFGHLLRLLRPERRRPGRSGGGGNSPRPRSPVAKAPNDAAAAARAEAGATAPVGAMAAINTGVSDPSPRLVALDGMGVLYREGDDIAQLLVPFVRARGSDVPLDEIVSRARLLSLGRITPAEFWYGVGVSGDANELDDAYLSLFQLTPGVVGFLRSLKSQGVRVACVTNDCALWANKLRVRHSLDGLIDPWVISGAVGVRKPDPPIYEVLRRVARLAPAEILVVDDNLENLDAARELGFATAWFAVDATTETSRGHAVLRSFAVTAPE